MTLKDNIRKILKEDTDFSTKFKRRYNWFKNYIKHCFVMEYPCDFENFTAFMQGIHQEIREAIFDGTYYDGEPVSDWLTYEEGAKFVDRHMITQLKEHYYDECGGSFSVNEQIESNDPDYSLETLNAIKKFVKVLELPLVKDFDVEWSEEQGLYRIKLYYLSRGNIKDINVLQNNEGKLQSVRPFFGLSPYTVAIQSYVVDEKSDNNDVITESDDTEYAVIEITKPLGYMDLKYYYQSVPYWKTKEDKIYVKKCVSGYKTISTKNIKVLKIFKNENDPEMKEYLKELRK